MEFSLAYGPLAYLHILYIKDPLRKFSWKDLLHFLPTVLIDGIFFVIVFIFIRLNMEWAGQNIPLIQGIALMIAFFGAIQLSCYTYLIYRESREAKRVLREFEKIKKWLTTLISTWSLLIGFLFLAVPIALIFIEQVDENSALIYKPMGSIIGICIYFLGYLYLLKYAKIVESYVERITKFTITPAELENKKEHLLQLLTEKELYKDPKLSLAKLAGHLNWPINSVSGVINESLQTNFNDLINHHRIVAFKDQLLRPENQRFSIEGIGQQVGFSSKASFYRAFKKETGMTPTQFIKNQP